MIRYRNRTRASDVVFPRGRTMPSMVVLGRLVTDKLVTSHRRHYKGVCDFPKICWVGKHVSIAAKPTNFRTQGQPNPRKFRLKSGILGHFFPQQITFRGLALVIYRKQTTRNLTNTNGTAHGLGILVPVNTSDRYYGGTY